MGISFAFAVLAFPKKVKEAYEVASQTVEQLQRPLYAISYGSLGSLDSKALELTRRLHRGSGICVIRQEMVDLSRDGWRADLLVEYALSPSGPALKCGEKDAERDAARYLAVFIPVSFSFRNAGTAGGKSTKRMGGNRFPSGQRVVRLQWTARRSRSGNRTH